MTGSFSPHWVRLGFRGGGQTGLSSHSFSVWFYMIILRVFYMKYECIMFISWLCSCRFLGVNGVIWVIKVLSSPSGGEYVMSVQCRSQLIGCCCVCTAGLVVSHRSGSFLSGSDHQEMERHERPDRAAIRVWLLRPTRSWCQESGWVRTLRQFNLTPHWMWLAPFHDHRTQRWKTRWTCNTSEHNS